MYTGFTLRNFDLKLLLFLKRCEQENILDRDWLCAISTMQARRGFVFADTGHQPEKAIFSVLWIYDPALFQQLIAFSIWVQERNDSWQQAA